MLQPELAIKNPRTVKFFSGGKVSTHCTVLKLAPTLTTSTAHEVLFGRKTVVQNVNPVFRQYIHRNSFLRRREEFHTSPTTSMQQCFRQVLRALNNQTLTT